MRKKTEAEDRNTNNLKARVQAVAASNKARSTIPMLGKGSKTRQGRGEEAGVTPSKRATWIEITCILILIIVSQAAHNVNLLVVDNKNKISD